MAASYVLKLLHKLPIFYSLLRGLKNVENQNHLIAKLLIENNKTRKLNFLSEIEFKVYSQFGDDGIIQYLINVIKIKKDEERFVEIGTEDYTESNTRFLLVNNNWSGLLIEADKDAVDFIKRDSIYWKHDLTAVSSFVTTKNINNLISEKGFSGRIGLLSIDIDGNDYWVWKALKAVDPVIVVAEYNGVFGYRKAVTIPYNNNFTRYKAHHSGLFWGCSLKALNILADSKGYIFVGTNSAGNNAYFVKKNRLNKLKPVSLKEGFTNPKYRESRDLNGKLTFVSGENKLHLLKDMILFNIESNKIENISKIYNI
jgi:hypothetical protein